MSREVRISLTSRGATCIARLLDDEAPRTCAALWELLPFEAPAWHSKTSYAEVYALFPAESALPLENPCFAPLPGDLVHFSFARTSFPKEDPRTRGLAADGDLSCIGSFYERHSVHRIESGIVPGSRFGEILGDLESWREACYSLLEHGSAGERLRIEQTVG